MRYQLIILPVGVLLYLIGFHQALNLKNLIYDESYIRAGLSSKYHYLKLSNGNYIGPRDYFNFTLAVRPNREYLESTDLEQVLYEELRASEILSAVTSMDQWHYSRPEEEVSHLANEELCNKQVDYIESQLSIAKTNGSNYLFKKGFRNQQLVRYIDSWARPPSEAYHGHSYWVGSYSRCMKSRLEYSIAEDKTTEMTFNFCWAKLRLKSWPKEEELYPPTSFRAGICLPRSCDTRWANRNKRRIMKILQFNFSPMHRDRFNKLIHVFCLPDGVERPFPFETRLFLLIIFTWIVFIVGVSLGFFSSKYKHLSIMQSWNTFNEDNQPVNSQGNKLNVDLRSIGVVRFLACVGICLGHCTLAYIWVFNSSSIAIEGCMRVRNAMLLWFMKSLDVHLVIAGLMTSYTIIGKFTGGKIETILKPKVFLLINLARFLRLAPMLILTLTFMKTLYRYLGEGPMWDYGVNYISLQGQCINSSWLRSLLIIPILFGYKGNPYLSECLAVSWYSIIDIKLALLGPVIVYLLQRQHSKSWQRTLLLLSIMIASFAMSYFGLSMQKLMYFKQFFTYGQILGVNILHMKFGESSYFSVISRLHTFACGIWAGYYLQLYKTGRIRKWPFWMRGWCFKIILFYQLYAFITSNFAISYFNRYGVSPSEETIKLSLILGPRIDAIVFAIFITRLASDLSTALMRNTLPLYKLSKLSYCVFLIHTIIISYVVSATEHSRFDTHFMQLLTMATFTVTASFLISFPLHLLFELPLAELCVKGPLASFRNKAKLTSSTQSKHE